MLAICKAAGLDCKMVVMEHDAMVPALKDKKIDVMAVGMTITEKHQKQVGMTEFDPLPRASSSSPARRRSFPIPRPRH